MHTEYLSSRPYIIRHGLGKYEEKVSAAMLLSVEGSGYLMLEEENDKKWLASYDRGFAT